MMGCKLCTVQVQVQLYTWHFMISCIVVDRTWLGRYGWLGGWWGPGWRAGGGLIWELGSAEGLKHGLGGRLWSPRRA
jgi:hypothetical protein